MRTKNMLLTAVVIGLAVVAGLLGVGGTWALWNASVQSNAGTVTAANFDVTVNTKSMAQNGWKVTIDPMDTNKPLSPTQQVHAALTVQNTTNSSGPLIIEVDPSTPVVPTVNGLKWSDYITVRSVPSTSDKCSSAQYPNLSFADPPVRTLRKNEFVTYCLEIGFKPNPPAELVNKTFSVDVQLMISQL